MKKHLSSLLGLAIALSMAAAAVVQHAWGRAVHTVSAAAEFFSVAFDRVTLRIVAGLPSAEPTKAASLVGYVKERAFQLRQIKRERPVITPTWRACPSI